MIELPLVFIAGVLGSSHCIGMCGPFALAIGSESPSWRTNLLRQSIYTIGRLFTYATMGAVAGFAGLRLQAALPWLRNTAAILAVIAGVFLIYQGAVAAGLWRRKATIGKASPCLAGTFFASFLRSPGWTNIFLAGLFTGMLPCGLVYAFLALAASSGGVGAGAALMAVFGLGTAPVMMLAGAGGSLLSLANRKRLLQAAAWCVMVTGCLSIARGVGFLDIPLLSKPTGCPACQNKPVDLSAVAPSADAD